MKIYFLFLTISIGSVFSANTYSQATRLSINLNNVSIEQLFLEIEKTSEYIFFYKENIPVESKISVNAKNETLESILEKTLKSKNLSYQINDRQVIVTENKNTERTATENGTQQQPHMVTGIVVDLHGEPLIGVSIKVKQTTAGTATDVDGKFKIHAEPGSTLNISYIGYSKASYEVTDTEKNIRIVLTEDLQSLKEVVVVGYGTLEKKQVTSSISSLSGDKLTSGVGGATIANAMEGKISGLIMSGTDSPNATNTFQLRGIASINAGKDPLIVIDGMPGGDIRSVLQEDILSIDVLKDASAGAIYGTRATAGVILITTRNAQASESGKVKTTLTSEVTFKQAFGKPEMLNGDEYIEHGRGKDYGARVDWWDESLNDNPTSQKYMVNLQGGSKDANLYATFMWENNKGVVKADERTDFAGRLNGNFKLLDGWLDVKMHADYRQAARAQSSPNMQQALRNNPTRSPYDSNSQTGYNVWTNETLDYNSIADAGLYTNQGLDKWLAPDVLLKLNILPVTGLSYQQTIGYDYRQWEKHTFRSRYHREELENKRTGEGYLDFEKTENINTEGYLTYVNSFNDHYINAVAGYSYYEHNGEKFDMTNYNFTNDRIKFWDMGNGTYLQDGEAKMSSNKSITERLTAYFARANYSFKDRYMISGTFRHEGSSKFAINNRWGDFWSVSTGWRLSEENFMKNINWVSDLKLRVGYGVTGNNNFDANYAATMYSSDQYWLMPSGNWARSYGKSKNINNELKWEEMHEWNFGLDYSFFNNRLYGKFDYYQRKVEGMIYNVQVPQPPYTEQQMYMNIGDMENKGWEFEIGGDVVKSKNWNYSTSLNLSNNSTKIKTLWGNQTYYDFAGFPSPGNPGDAIRIEEGTTIGSFYIWKFAGFDDAGNFLLYNKDGKVIPASEKTQEDKQHIGNYMPELIMGWTHNLSYKNWDLGLTLTSWVNFDVYNSINMYMGLPNTGDGLNVLKDAYTKFAHINGEKQLCDYFLEDGTFLKIQNVNVAYNLDLKKYTKLMDKARFYLTINNVATFTKYSGVNPQVNITGYEGGIEKFDGLYPQTRAYALGLQLTF